MDHRLPLTLGFEPKDPFGEAGPAGYPRYRDGQLALLLRAIFNSAVNDELLVKSPCRLPKGGADRAIERKVPTIAEVQALAQEMPENLRVAASLAAWGALGRGEILALRRRDIDPLRSSVRIERAQVELSDGTVLFTGPKKPTRESALSTSLITRCKKSRNICRTTSVPTPMLSF